MCYTSFYKATSQLPNLHLQSSCTLSSSDLLVVNLNCILVMLSKYVTFCIYILCLHLVLYILYIVPLCDHNLDIRSNQKSKKSLSLSLSLPLAFFSIFFCLFPPTFHSPGKVSGAIGSQKSSSYISNLTVLAVIAESFTKKLDSSSSCIYRS